MEFEFDEPKNRTNKARHGIDFIEAQALWKDVDVLEVPAKTKDEPRAIVIGKIGDIQIYIGRPSSHGEKTGSGSYPSDDPGRRSRNSMKAKDLDKRFDAGENITKALDVTRAQRINRKQRRINVDFPSWMIHSLDKEADRLGVTRQSIIKVWISERLKEKTA